jgi:polysaccharide biosynthesis protein PslE
MQTVPSELIKGSPVRALADGFFRQRRIFVAVFVMVLLPVVLWTLIAKKQYRSEMKFLLENNRSNAVITADRSASPSVTEITEQQINSELDILGSEDVIGAVADPAWVALPPNKKKSPEALKSHGQKMVDFRKRLKIDPSRRSNVITVSLAAPSPAEATAALELFSSAYLAHRKLLSRPSGTSSFFAEEAHRYQDAWQQANRQLVEFQQRNHLISVPQTEETLNKAIASYEDDERSNGASLSELEGRLSESRHAARTVPQRQKTQQHVSFSQGSVDQMRTMLVQLENRRTELLTRYTEKERLVQEVERQIADTTASLNAALTLKGSEDVTDINPAWQEVQSSLVEGRIEQRALRAKSSSLKHSISSLRNQLSRLQSLDVPFNALEEKADQARSNFELFAQKRDQAQIEDAMDERKMVNIAVAESPTFPFKPVAPKPLLNAALGLFTAFFLAAGTVLLAELSRTTVATARELESLSRYPVLATAPYDAPPSKEPWSGFRKWAVSNTGRSQGRARNMVPAMQKLRGIHEG